MSAQLWLTSELLHSEVCNGAFTGRDLDALAQGPQ